MRGSLVLHIAIVLCIVGTGVGLNGARARAAQTCTITPPASYDFGNYDTLGVKVNTTGSIAVSCTGTGTTTPVVSLSAGGSGDENNRSMACVSGACLSTFPGDLLLYNIYTNSGRTIVWGAAGQAYASCSNTCTKSKTAFGDIPKAIAGSTNDVAVGGYSDTITITANY